MDEYIGGSIFSKIESDDRVVPGLQHCLHCKVSQSGTNKENWYKDIDYKIPLDCINGDSIKQCPACKKIYILSNPTKW